DLNGGLVMKNPEYEKVSSDPSHAARIVPIYPETRGLTSRCVRPKIRPLLWLADQLVEVLPGEILARRGFTPRAAAVKQVHFPESMEALERARDRFEFEEIFLNQLANQLAKRARKAHPAHAIAFDEHVARAFVAALPFKLTNAQRKAAWQVFQDMMKAEPMNRLLEGDVGSGKTVVAAMAMHHVAKAGFQSMLLAPTEILARQHAEVIESLLRPFGVVVGLLLGSTPTAARRSLLASVASGAVHVLLGTHALIQESDKLGVRSATQEVEKLQREVFPDLAPRIALLHGRMKTAEKEDVMARFQRGEVAILVSTSVVEVGIDIPNATVMMIEGADR